MYSQAAGQATTGELHCRRFALPRERRGIEDGSSSEHDHICAHGERGRVRFLVPLDGSVHELHPRRRSLDGFGAVYPRRDYVAVREKEARSTQILHNCRGRHALEHVQVVQEPQYARLAEREHLWFLAVCSRGERHRGICAEQLRELEPVIESRLVRAT